MLILSKYYNRQANKSVQYFDKPACRTGRLNMTDLFVFQTAPFILTKLSTLKQSLVFQFLKKEQGE